MAKEMTSKASGVWVWQAWLGQLPMQMQSVLSLACRGPDTVEKNHQCKGVIRRYRATILKSAYYGRSLKPDDVETDFMSLAFFSGSEFWDIEMQKYFDVVDVVPHHYHLHLLHGAEIIGYHHPNRLFRERWSRFYFKGCDNMHLNPETQKQLDARLSDWGQKHWGEDTQ